ncbi:MAG: hypothetical protein WCZ89_05690 [Phycisphaerae bacterium]
MSKAKKYTKEPGDQEIRILADGRLVLVGLDEDMLSFADAFVPLKETKENKGKRGWKNHNRRKTFRKLI